MSPTPNAAANGSSPSATQWIGTMLTRIVVPLWILTGAVFKLVERTPSNLPSQIVRLAKDQQLDLALVLRSLIGLEFLAIAVMLFLPRFARVMAIFILACFCAILINEIRVGATSCGCFGTVKINPWIMLAIDGLLLSAVILFRPIPAAKNPTTVDGSGNPWRRNWPIAAVIAIIAGLGVAFVAPEKPTIAQPTEMLADTSPAGNAPLPPSPKPGDGVGEGAKPQAAKPDATGALSPQQTTVPAPAAAQQVDAGAPAKDPTRNPSPLPLPSWFSPSVDKWVGQPWRETELFRFMPVWPRNLDEGRHYVIFYSKTCDHCHLLLENFFAGQPPISTVLIEIPAKSPTGEPPLPMPTKVAQFLSLPKGPDWMITTPLMAAIEDGKVVCAQEGADPDDPKCLQGWMQ
jgi:hypothetical protein